MEDEVVRVLLQTEDGVQEALLSTRDPLDSAVKKWFCLPAAYKVDISFGEELLCEGSVKENALENGSVLTVKWVVPFWMEMALRGWQEPMPFRVGQAVEANWQDSGSWYPAHIEAVLDVTLDMKIALFHSGKRWQSSQAYTVAFDEDGEVETPMPRHRIRRQSCEEPDQRRWEWQDDELKNAAVSACAGKYSGRVQHPGLDWSHSDYLLELCGDGSVVVSTKWWDDGPPLSEQVIQDIPPTITAATFSVLDVEADYDGLEVSVRLQMCGDRFHGCEFFNRFVTETVQFRERRHAYYTCRRG